MAQNQITGAKNNKNTAEFSALAVTLGTLLSVVMCAANTYLGLYAGMTVSAAIPAAVISMGILRGVLRRGTLLENNMVQTIASAGESLAAGAIFTIPALVITGAWAGFNYWQTTMIVLCGGVLGTLFMIPLRRSLIIEDKELIYPEGVACAEVLEAGDRGGAKVGYVFASLAAGAVFKFFVSGVTLIRGTIEWARAVAGGVFYFGADISPALLGVGYIVGFNVAALVFIGGCIGWLAGIPILAAVSGGAPGKALDFAWGTWSGQIRYLGVGAMVVGGVWSIVKVRKGIAKGFGEALGGLKAGDTGNNRDNNVDIPSKMIVIMLLITVTAIFFIYRGATGSFWVGGVATAAMVISAFFFVAVSSYIVGLVGSSNNPVSGMTICTVLFTGAMLLLFGMKGAAGILATLCVAGVVCCAACTGGDTSQDLKTGHLVGASPRFQQWGQLIGVVAAAFVIAPILVVLDSSYGIGTGAPGALKAPQATLFAGLTKAMFGDGELPWTMISIGAGIGVVMIILDEILKAAKSPFRTHVMPVAVGIYLPLSLATTIFVGGLISLAAGRSENAEKGILCSSGLIAGEAITGILIGAAIYFKKGILPISVNSPAIVTVVAASLLVFSLLKISRGKEKIQE